MRGISACYRRELKNDRYLGGKIVVKFVIAKDGSVSRVSTKSSTMRNSAVESCINNRFGTFKFPKPKGGGIVIVSYPFLFS
jgi:outer membrane biosynthesis protein TonB